MRATMYEQCERKFVYLISHAPGDNNISLCLLRIGFRLLKHAYQVVGGTDCGI